MPARKTPFIKVHYYHIYNRGSGKQPIFFEEENYRYLLRLFKKDALVEGVSIIA
jgi:hypothetical protein